MALKNFEFKVDISGIVPNTITNAGTQGDHGVTRLNFVLSDELRQGVNRFGAEGNVLLYRFDIYDGEGCIFQSKPTMLNEENIFVELEERHTRFGGKITVYLVITALSSDNKTEMELYNFPVVLRLKNRPEGVYKDGANYESVSGLAKIAEQGANTAVQAAVLARHERESVSEYVSSIEEKLNNGEFDGVGVESAQIVDDELIITYTNGAVQNLGNVKGDTGPQGEKGDKGDTGDTGKDAVTDQTFNPESENAQSGKSVAEAIDGCVPKIKTTFGPPYCNVITVHESAETDENGLPLNKEYKHTPIDEESVTPMPGWIVRRNSNGNVRTNIPIDDTDATNKKYVDDAVANVSGGNVDLTDYVKNTDYATTSKGGVIKPSNTYALSINSAGSLMCNTYSANEYATRSNGIFISKGTLDNILAEKLGDIETSLSGIAELLRGI